jgi:hypothetical protein
VFRFRFRFILTNQIPIPIKIHSVVDVTAAVQALLPNPPISLNIPAVGNAALGGVDPAPGKVKELKASRTKYWFLLLDGGLDCTQTALSSINPSKPTSHRPKKPTGPLQHRRRGRRALQNSA